MKRAPLILIVGVCASGKTTLSAGLRKLGFNARSLAQEHSVSATLWRRLQPDLLIVLDCSYETVRRRKRISWGKKRYREQQALLENARKHSVFLVKTDKFTPEQLLSYVQNRLEWLGVYPGTRRLNLNRGPAP